MPTFITWLATGVSIADGSIPFDVDDRVEISGGIIPGIESGRYWVSAVQVVDGKQQVQISITQDGTAVPITGEIIGAPRITTVVAKNPVLAFAQLKKWLEATSRDWLTTSLNDWSITEVN